MKHGFDVPALYRQASYDVQFERGESGLRALAQHAAVIVIVDVLSFSTAVDVAIARGALVRAAPFRDQDAMEIAARYNALLAVPRSERSTRSPYSLSPPTLAALPKGARLVLPSPNGATLLTLVMTKTKARIVVGCLAERRVGSSIHAGAC